MMYVDILLACWAVFIVYWIVSARGIKKDVYHHNSWWVSVGGRVLFVAIVFIAFRFAGVRRFVEISLQRFAFRGSVTAIVGLVLCAAGVAIAVWARTVLGRNWSERPAIKEGHELVTAGPYGIVRHPIYLGMLVAILGTTLVTGLPGLVVFACFLVVAIRRIGVEERLMMQLFPGEYPQYRRRTKALIPYLV